MPGPIGDNYVGKFGGRYVMTIEMNLEDGSVTGLGVVRQACVSLQNDITRLDSLMAEEERRLADLKKQRMWREAALTRMQNFLDQNKPEPDNEL